MIFPDQYKKTAVPETGNGGLNNHALLQDWLVYDPVAHLKQFRFWPG